MRSVLQRVELTAQIRKICGDLNAGTRKMTGRRDGSGRRSGGGSGGGGGWPWYGRTLHWQASSTPSVVSPGPVQSTDQGISEILREEAVDVERDRVIDHFQQVGQGTEHL